MRIGLFGGTFDPVHLGHLIMAEAAREICRLDHVIFLPASQPLHKRPSCIGARHRLAMVRLAIRGHSAFKVSDWEIRQKRPVFTYEALAHFHTAFPGHSLFFIVGSDALRDIPRWREGVKLLKQARFVVLERLEVPLSRIKPSLLRKVTSVHAPHISIASHEVRQRVASGKSIHYQVPEAVERYIGQHRLYR